MPKSERDDLISRMRETRQTLLETLAAKGYTEETATLPTKPGDGGEGEWSAKQQLAHMAEVERLWVDWARRAAAGDPNVGPKANAPDRQISGSQFTAHSHSLYSLIRQINDARQYSMEVIAAIPDEALQRVGDTHSGDLTVLQMLRALYRHDRMHLEQIQGQDGSFTPRIVR
ncbi:MAG: DinB family protein [Chloroflexi bacterium]|nr:DinB family protein [Chloroflexota bacterium]